MENIKRKAFVGVFWSIIERFGSQLVTFTVSLILARILSPREFGLVGMIAVFTAIGQTIVDSGFGSALIQKKNITRVDESSVFYFNTFVGALLSTLLFISAPIIAGFYNQQELVLITKVISLNLFIGSFAAVPNNLLSKELNFKIQAKVTILSALLSGVVGLYFAFNGYGVWALVYQVLSATLFRSVFIFLFTKWYPLLKFRLESLKGLFAFGSRLLLSGLLNTVFMNLYKLIIGKLYSAVDLGYYNRGNGFFQLITGNTVGVIGKVVYPTLSKVQNDNEEFVSAFSHGLKILSFVTIPMMLGLCAVADNFITFLITDKWIQSVPYLRVLTLMGVLLPISTMNLQALNAKGRSDLFLKLEVIKKVAMSISIFLSYKYGITMMLLSHFVFVSITSVVLNTIYSGKIFNYGTLKQFKSIYKIFVASILMMISTYYLGQALELGVGLKLFIQLSYGILSYVVISYLLDKGYLFSLISELKALKR